MGSGSLPQEKEAERGFGGTDWVGGDRALQTGDGMSGELSTEGGGSRLPHCCCHQWAAFVLQTLYQACSVGSLSHLGSLPGERRTDARLALEAGALTWACTVGQHLRRPSARLPVLRVLVVTLVPYAV